MKKIKEVDGWLNISMDGFAEQNAARPIEHLIKELVQNSLDSLPTSSGEINLYTQACPQCPQPSNSHSDSHKTPHQCWVICEDNGEGIQDIENLRTVFWTSKKDSHLKRGRMGRGFKELLCLSKEVHVESLNHKAHFIIDKNKTGDKHKLVILQLPSKLQGTRVRMLVNYKQEELSQKIKGYFETLLVPPNCKLKVEGKLIEYKKPKYTVDTTLTTESFESSRWVKPQKKTQIELVELAKSQDQGLIYEMGIPICPAEWDIPFHANVCQRVPMNPNRDAVMSGYASKIHKSALSSVLNELSSEQTRSAWVGEAAASSLNPDLQRAVLKKAFGENLARSVPGFGKFDHDADATEATGAKILDTKQLSGGFRELAKSHLPTSKEVAQNAHNRAAEIASSNTVDLDKAKNEAKAIINKYGKEHIKNVCQLHKFLADEILKELFGEKAPKCTVHTAIMAMTAEATWSNERSILTLALDLERIWETPLHKDNFSLIIHEVAHELAAHHGRSFADALEQCGGIACTVLLKKEKELAKIINQVSKEF